jgi:hypothetical protein
LDRGDRLLFALPEVRAEVRFAILFGSAGGFLPVGSLSWGQVGDRVLLRSSGWIRRLVLVGHRGLVSAPFLRMTIHLSAARKSQAKAPDFSNDNRKLRRTGEIVTLDTARHTGRASGALRRTSR